MIRCIIAGSLFAMTLTAASVARSGEASRPRAGDVDVLLGQRAIHPLSALIGLPDAATRSADAPWKLVLAQGNAFMGGGDADESLFLDGESLRLSARWQRRLDACWSLGAEAGVVSHDGGLFDAGIESWHDAFGLPNAGRATAPRNGLRFAYERTGDEGPPVLESATAGVADSQLWLQRTIGCDPVPTDRRSILRFGVKLPTGRLRDWSGSGAADVWADVQSAVHEPWAGMRVGASVGLLVTGRTARLDALRPVVGFGAFGLRYRAGPRLALHAAIDWHTPLFDSDLVELGAMAASLATGLSFAPGPRSRIDVQILEDVFIDTASDITLRIALTLTP